MPQEPTITLAVATVLREFVVDISQPRYGYDLMRATGYPSGKLYPILAKLEHAKWIRREREDLDPAQAGRPARYFYTLTEHGAEVARNELSTLREQLDVSPRRLRSLRPEGGLT